MGIVFLLVAFGVPYWFFRYFLKFDVHLTLGLTLSMMPVTNYGLVALAYLLGMSATGIAAFVLVLGSVVFLLPIGVFLLITRAICWLIVGKPIVANQSLTHRWTSILETSQFETLGKDMTGNSESLSDLAKKFDAMVSRLNVGPYYKRFHTTPQNDGSPHIELSSEGFDLVVTERGSEIGRKSRLSADEVLYCLLEGITFHMATEYELRHRVVGADGRRVWFTYQEELMARLNPDWGTRLKSRHQQILLSHPFNP